MEALAHKILIRPIKAKREKQRRTHLYRERINSGRREGEVSPSSLEITSAVTGSIHDNYIELPESIERKIISDYEAQYLDCFGLLEELCRRSA
jgi:hypothetical protein